MDGVVKALSPLSVAGVFVGDEGDDDEEETGQRAAGRPDDDVERLPRSEERFGQGHRDPLRKTMRGVRESMIHCVRAIVRSRVTQTNRVESLPGRSAGSSAAAS